MLGTNVLLFITRRGKIYLTLILISILAIIGINTAIFANITSAPMEGINIIIDPGHGGVDGGTNDGETFLEKDINLKIAIKLREILAAGKARVDLTRDCDISLDDQNNLSSSRHSRDLMARVAQFNSGKYDLFISLHVNRSTSRSATGPMVLYSPKLPHSGLLAACLQVRLNAHSQGMLPDNAVHRPVASSYYVLNNSSIPGVIVECGFISNPTEKKLLQEADYRQKLCNAIYSGIKDYLRNKENGTKGMEEILPSDDEEDLPFNIMNEVRLVER